MDCALAELYTKQIATQQLTEHHQQAEIFHSIHDRMNEVSHLTGLESCLDWHEMVGRRMTSSEEGLLKSARCACRAEYMPWKASPRL